MQTTTGQPIWQIKKDICDIGSRIWQKGFCAGNEGNHSVRIGRDRFLCTPTGLSKGFLEPDDIITDPTPLPGGRAITRSHSLLRILTYRMR